MQEGQDNTKGKTQSEHGDNTHPPHPAIQQGHRANDKGDANTQKGDTNTQDGEGQHRSTRPSFTMPPTIHDGPTHHHCEGEGGQRIPHHTNNTDTHSPPTRHTPGRQQCTT